MTTLQLDIHKDIIESSKAGDRKSQFKLYQLYAKAMFNICHRIVNNIEEAEDILQESFTDAFKRLGSFRYESTFGAWLKKIVINHSINALKKKKTELVFFEDMHIFNSPEKEEEEITLSVEAIRKAMTQLPEGGRVIFSLYLLEGYDHSEISEILGVSESTSKSQYIRAKNKVKEILKQTY